MTTSTVTDRFLTVYQAMEIVGVKARVTLWRWGRAGIFPKPRKLGPRKVGYLESELREWVERRRAQ